MFSAKSNLAEKIWLKIQMNIIKVVRKWKWKLNKEKTEQCASKIVVEFLTIVCFFEGVKHRDPFQVAVSPIILSLLPKRQFERKMFHRKGDDRLVYYYTRHVLLTQHTSWRDRSPLVTPCSPGAPRARWMWVRFMRLRPCCWMELQLLR